MGLTAPMEEARSENQRVNVTFTEPAQFQPETFLAKRIIGLAAFDHGVKGPKTPKADGRKLKMPNSFGMVKKTHLGQISY